MGYERLKKLINSAINAPAQIAERQVNDWQEPVTVEIVNGVPTYFIGDDEVSASEAADELDNRPAPQAA